MATAGSIVIDLLMKTGGFETDSKRAEKRMQELSKAAKRAGTIIGGAFATAATTAAVALKGSIDRMDELSKAAQRANMPTEDFSRLAYAGELADVAMEDLTKSMGKLAKAQGDAAQGLTTQVRGFEALGIAFKEADGSLRSTTDVFLDFADVFQKNRGSPEVMALGMQVFGRSFQNLIPLLKDGRAGLQAMADEADRFGYTIGTEAGQQAEEFNDNLTRLKTIAHGLANEVASNLLPDLVDLSAQFVDGATEGGRMKTIADSLAESIRDLASAFQQVVGFIGKLGELRQGLADFENSWRKAFDFGFNKTFSDALKEAAPFLYNDKQLGRPDFSNVQGGPRIQRLATTTVFAPGSGGLTISGPEKKAKAGKSEAEKAAEALQRAYESLNASLAEQVALFGEVGEAARVRYEIENGSLKGLAPALAEGLITRAEELDLLHERQKIMEEGKQLIESLLTDEERVNQERERAAELLAAGAIAQEDYNRAIEAFKTPAEQMLADLSLQAELLGKSAEEQARLTAAAYLGAEAFTATGQAAIQAAGDFEVYAQAIDDQIELMDGIRDAGKGLFEDLIGGTKSWKDAFTDALDTLVDRINQIVAQKLIDQLFGQQGTTGGGSAGGAGFWTNLLGSLFGGARASGGDVISQTAYLVGEQGPELFVPRTAGTVVPANKTQQIMNGGNSFTQVNNMTFRAPTTTRTQTQVASRVGFEVRRSQRLGA